MEIIRPPYVESRISPQKIDVMKEYIALELQELDIDANKVLFHQICVSVFSWIYCFEGCIVHVLQQAYGLFFRQCTSPLNGLGTRTRKRLPTKEENSEALTSISSRMTDQNQLWVHQTQAAGPGRPKRTKSFPTRAAEYSTRIK